MKKASALETWRTTAAARVDCLTCGDTYRDDDHLVPVRRWAQAHAWENPTHHVAMEISYDRIYRGMP